MCNNMYNNIKTRLKTEMRNYRLARVGYYVLAIIIPLIMGVIIHCLCCNKSEFKDIQILIALIVVIIAVFLLIGFISAILRIYNITHKIRFINSTIMRMECCSDDSKKIELEINRLTQELNADSSRDIWRAIFNSR